MAENQEATEPKAKRGRKPKDPNAPPKEKRVAKGRKYFVVDATEYEAFVANKTSYQSLEAAMQYADQLATEAEDAGNPNLRLAVFVEAGILSAKVEKKVVRNFASSRTLQRHAAAESEGGAPAAQQTPETNAAPSPQGQTATIESTHSEAPSARRRR